MLYLANPSTPAIRDAMDGGRLGCIATPAQGNRLSTQWTWAADNGCFSDAWTEARWLRFLHSPPGDMARCLFAVVPDVVADHDATLARWHDYSPLVRALGYRTAFVLQDAANRLPWDDLDCLFIGGSTAYKLSAEAERWAREAKYRGKWVHWGRVNSRRRFAMAAPTGDSCDGTFLTFGPDRNLPRLLAWTNPIDWQVSA